MRPTHIIDVLLVAALTVGSAFAQDEAPANADSGHVVAGHVSFAKVSGAPAVEVSETVVWLAPENEPEHRSRKDTEADGGAADLPVVHLDQEDITYVPHVVAVQIGHPLQVHNSDTILHNVHTRSKKNREFNRAQIANKTFEVTFRNPEIIFVGCDVHSQMAAWLVVVPTPYFAMANKDGSFTLRGVPAGRYVLTGWNEKYGRVSTPIVVGDTDASADFVFERPLSDSDDAQTAGANV